MKFGISFTLIHLNQAGALVHLYRDGSISLNHGGTEMGQGLFVKVAQVVAEEFGVPLDKVKITATSTAKVPNTSPTAASAGTDLNAQAALNACRQIKDRLYAFIEEKWNVTRERVEFADGKVLIGNTTMELGELATAAMVNRVQLSATGYYKTPKITWDREKVSGRPFYYFAYGAACSEVIVDTMTGEMRVTRVDILHDVGKSLNPAIDIGQIEGGFVQGMGWLTTEELVWDSAGRLRTHAPSTYKIPTASDVPADFPRGAVRVRRQPRGLDLSLQGGRRAAADAGDLGVLGDHRRHRQPEAGGDAAPRRAGDAGGDHARHPRFQRARGMTAIWRQVLDGLDRHGRLAMVTIAAKRGSSPRDAGARMIVYPDATFSGTIGGGTLEWKAIAMAQAALANPNASKAETRGFALGPELGQCCGGNVELVLEIIEAERRAEVATLAEKEATGALTTRGRLISDRGVIREIVEDALPPGAAAYAGGVLTEGFGDERRPLVPVRRRPRRPRAGDGAGAAAVPRDLGRSAAGCVSGVRSRPT